ncbi:hypothetical protein QUF07_02310 [Lentilactobacillus sp. TOM.63]|uniref:hypothetical protein n=1 Tax=Lentilactobacillus sp. TOM.63 TaxID=3055077 RepID=UPI0025A187AB|nr:hypothetical protein [Lentilactobacillus sp. TOM.63]MDM7515538.1 hypothetical protein [Lentilactobacillus sp. TOM.63]
MQQRYDQSNSKYVNEFGKIDDRLAEKEINKDFLVMSVELGISEDQINLMNQDEYVLNRAKAKLVRQEKESVIAQGVYYGMAKILNEMFGKKKGK